MPQDPRHSAPRALTTPPTLRLVADGDAEAPIDARLQELAALVTGLLRRERDWPYPLHSPLPPASPLGDEPLGLGKGHLPSRCTLALRALALMARRKADDRSAQRRARGQGQPAAEADDDGDERGRSVGVPTAEVLASLLEWWARRPGLEPQAGDQRHLALLEAIHQLADPEASRDFSDAATAWMADALPRAFQRDAAQAVDIDGLQAAAAAVARSHPRTARKLRSDADKQRLKLLSSRLFGQPADALTAESAGAGLLVCSGKECAATQLRLQHAGSRRALLARLLHKLLRAHLGLAAPGAGEAPHALEQAALALLPQVVAHGAPAHRAVAAQWLLALRPGSTPLDDTDLPRCFQAETLQSPQVLADQARFALLGANPQTDDPLTTVFDTVLALARDLARAVTDPMRADALGFSADQFRQWQDALENDVRARALPKRLKEVGGHGIAFYLAHDLLPRMHRWKDQHSVMARGGADAMAAALAADPQAAAGAGIGWPRLTVLTGRRRPRTAPGKP